MKRTLISLVVLAGLAAAATPAAGQTVDQLAARLNAVESKLKETRKTVKRQAARIAQLQRSQPQALASPDGRFGIGLTNEGLRLRGPGPSVVLGSTALTLSSGTGGSALQIAAGRTVLSSPQVFLGAGSSCPPVARRGDGVQVQGAGELLPGSIIGSSTGVFAC